MEGGIRRRGTVRGREIDKGNGKKGQELEVVDK